MLSMRTVHTTYTSVKVEHYNNNCEITKYYISPPSTIRVKYLIFVYQTSGRQANRFQRVFSMVKIICRSKSHNNKSNTFTADDFVVIRGTRRLFCEALRGYLKKKKKHKHIHVRYMVLTRVWIRVHPVGRSNESITIIIYTCTDVCIIIIMRVYVWQCVRARETGAAGNTIFYAAAAVR
jgi:hypothetical protein